MFYYGKVYFVKQSSNAKLQKCLINLMYIICNGNDILICSNDVQPRVCLRMYMCMYCCIVNLNSNSIQIQHSLFSAELVYDESSSLDTIVSDINTFSSAHSLQRML